MSKHVTVGWQKIPHSAIPRLHGLMDTETVESPYSFFARYDRVQENKANESNRSRFWIGFSWNGSLIMRKFLSESVVVCILGVYFLAEWV